MWNRRQKSCHPCLSYYGFQEPQRTIRISSEGAATGRQMLWKAMSKGKNTSTWWLWSCQKVVKLVRSPFWFWGFGHNLWHMFVMLEISDFCPKVCSDLSNVRIPSLTGFLVHRWLFFSCQNARVLRWHAGAHENSWKILEASSHCSIPTRWALLIVHILLPAYCICMMYGRNILMTCVNFYVGQNLRYLVIWVFTGASGSLPTPFLGGESRRLCIDVFFGVLRVQRGVLPMFGKETTISEVHPVDFHGFPG